MVRPQQVVARVIMHRPTFAHFFTAIHANVGKYERLFGHLKIRSPLAPHLASFDENPTIFSRPADAASAHSPNHEPHSSAVVENGSQSPDLAGLYEQLKLPDDLLPGTFANAVMITHMAEEFCMDFIVNSYPRSIVACRVFTAAGRIPSLLETIRGALDGSKEK
jgi:hypothetical protein